MKNYRIIIYTTQIKICLGPFLCWLQPSKNSRHPFINNFAVNFECKLFTDEVTWICSFWKNDCIMFFMVPIFLHTIMFHVFPISFIRHFSNNKKPVKKPFVLKSKKTPHFDQEFWNQKDHQFYEFFRNLIYWCIWVLRLKILISMNRFHISTSVVVLEKLNVAFSCNKVLWNVLLLYSPWMSLLVTFS